MRQKTGILGGTFNPPHEGHLEMARRARAELGLSRVIFVLSNHPPHKKLPARSPTAKQRLEMLRTAVAELPFAEISTLELERPGKSYTADTLNALRSEHPGDDFFLLMGSDMLYTFDSWYEPGRIASLCTLVAFPRREGEQDDMRACADALRRRFDAGVRLIMAPAVEVSSTEMRHILKAGGRDARIPQAVFDYIVRKGLYRGEC